MEVRRIGTYLVVDDRGYLKNDSRLDALPAHWRAALDALEHAYLTEPGVAIHSIYVRGSIARGLPVDGLSDIDSFAVMAPGTLETLGAAEYSALVTWAGSVGESIKARFPFVADVEAGFEAFENMSERSNPFTFTIKVEATCIHGDDLAAGIAPYRPGPEIAFQARHFHHNVEQFLLEYAHVGEQQRPEILSWMMRRFLRLGMEFVMVEEQCYSCDLYPCYESFARHYPDKAREMYRALELAVNPAGAGDAVALVRGFGEWLMAEARRQLAQWGYRESVAGDWVLAT